MIITKEQGLIATLSLVVLAVVSISIGDKIGTDLLGKAPPEMKKNEVKIFTDHEEDCQYLITGHTYLKTDNGYIYTGVTLVPRMSADGITQYGCKEVDVK